MPPDHSHDTLILEGIVTTISSSGVLNVAPMGPEVDRQLTRITLKPFATSTTGRNLITTGQGVVHVVDNVELIARGALGKWDEPPATRPADMIKGRVLEDCCSWFELQVDEIDDTTERLRITTSILHTGQRRPFFGFNRAKHAVLEAAILATRLHLIDSDTLQRQLEQLQVLVDKTAGEQERLAFDLILAHVEERNATTA